MDPHKKLNFVYDLAGLPFKSHPWHGINIGSKSPEEVNAFIELVPTDTVKYELDKISGYLKIDRPQMYSSLCPTIYGLLPQTYCAEKVGEYCQKQAGIQGIHGDKDPLDICVLTERTITYGGIHLKAIPIGGLRMIDDGEADDKIISVLEGDSAYGKFRDISEVSSEVIDRLKHYFLTYKDDPKSPERRCEIDAVYGREEAHEVIRCAQEDYKTHFPQMLETFQKYREFLKKH